jgi:hypothetical protein
MLAHTPRPTLVARAPELRLVVSNSGSRAPATRCRARPQPRVAHRRDPVCPRSVAWNPWLAITLHAYGIDGQLSLQSRAYEIDC